MDVRPTDDLRPETGDGRSIISRRTVVRGAAWTVPAVAVVNAIPQAAHASPGDVVVLWTSNFDSIGTGLPTGFTVRTGATDTAIGTTQSFTTTANTWASTSGNFRNVASADGLTASATTTQQNAATDRAVAVRQTGSFADPGAAFVVNIGPTTNRTGITVTFKAQSLDVSSPRVTTWTVDAFVGTSRITSGTTFQTGGSTFTNTTVNAIFPNTLNNLATDVYIRIAALAASTGSGNRPTTGIDDLTVTGTSTV